MAKAQKQTTDVAVVEEKNTAVSEHLAAFEQMGGMGMENVTANDVLIPRLNILQALSPQLNKNKPEFIKGAEIGQICDLAMGEAFVGPVRVVPVYYNVQYLEWAPRTSTRGLVAIHDKMPADITKNDKNQNMLPNGNNVVESRQFYCLLPDHGNRRVFIPMTGTQAKKAKKWMHYATNERIKNSVGKEFMPPLFYRVYVLETKHENNQQGDWYGWLIERGPTVQDLDNAAATITEAVEFHKSITRGEVRGDQDVNNAPDDVAEDGEVM
jgi:hypothetical protein